MSLAVSGFLGWAASKLASKKNIDDEDDVPDDDDYSRVRQEEELGAGGECQAQQGKEEFQLI